MAERRRRTSLLLGDQRTWLLAAGSMFLVAIAYGKGVILKVAYEKMKISANSYEHTSISITFARAGPKMNRRTLFVMDNDPSQRSKSATMALTEIEAELLEIAPRSPDINCIENVFHLVKRLEEEAIAENITDETSVEQFKQRVFRALDSIPSGVIDNIILSMNLRIEAILLGKRHRTKY